MGRDPDDRYRDRAQVRAENISEIAAAAGIGEAYVEPYGRHKAKISLDLLREKAAAPDGKLILVTAITPTPAGEGKTTTSIGLTDALRRCGKKRARRAARAVAGAGVRH